MDNFALLTLTNNGYREYTDNMIESLKRLGLEEIINVYCIDEEAYEYFKNRRPNNKVFLIKNLYGKKVSEFTPYQEGDWEDIVYNKLNIIRDNLKKGINIIFVDGDIVFLKNPIARLKELIRNNVGKTSIFQNDAEEGNGATNNLCSGFMFIKAEPIMETLMNPFDKKFEVEGQVINFRKRFIICDQLYFNSIKNMFNYSTFNVEEFPNGFHWKRLRDKPNFDPYIIHFNCMIGHEKKERMKEHNYWYI